MRTLSEKHKGGWIDPPVLEGARNCVLNGVYKWPEVRAALQEGLRIDTKRWESEVQSSMPGSGFMHFINRTALKELGKEKPVPFQYAGVMIDVDG